MSKAGSDESGVYYNRSDYASLPIRFLIAGVDLIVLVIIANFISWLWMWAEPPDIVTISENGWLSAAILSPKFFWVVTGIAYFYLVIAKQSRFRTVGYRIFKVKIVDLHGSSPKLATMTWRFILLVFGPFNLLMDLVWLGGDENRQTLRDKFAGTYVVSVRAHPAGIGPIIFENYYLLGLAMIFRKVKRSDP